MTSFFAFILMCPKMCGHLGVSNHVIFVWTCPHFSRQSWCIEVVFVFKGFFELSGCFQPWQHTENILVFIITAIMILYSSVAVSHYVVIWTVSHSAALHCNPIVNCWFYHVFFIFILSPFTPTVLSRARRESRLKKLMSDAHSRETIIQGWCRSWNS